MEFINEWAPWLTNTPLLIGQGFSGLMMGAFILLVSVGLNLIFGISRVVNFAHGAFFMLGAYLMVTVSQLRPGIVWFAASIGIVFLATGLLGGVCETLLLRRVYKKGKYVQFILTFGLALMIEGLVQFIWGTEYPTLSRPEWLSESIEIYDWPVPTYNIAIIVFTALIVVVMGLLARLSAFGIRARAASTDRDMLEALGVNSNRLMTQVFMLSTGLAGMVGALAAPTITIGLGMGTEVLLNSLIVVVIGGLGSIPGSILGALIVGQMQSFGILVLPEMSAALMYVVMFFVLIVRPWGLLGSPEGRSEELGVGQ